MGLMISKAKREEGFTLIELLVVVIIIGILAAIAIPIFLNQRAQAWERTAQSDVRNAAIALESFFNDEFEYPATADVEWIDGVAELDNGEEIRESTNIELGYARGGDNNDEFIVCAIHENIDEDEWVAVYHSAGGGILDEPNRQDTEDGDCTFANFVD